MANVDLEEPPVLWSVRGLFLLLALSFRHLLQRDRDLSRCQDRTQGAESVSASAGAELQRLGQDFGFNPVMACPRRDAENHKRFTQSGYSVFGGGECFQRDPFVGVLAPLCSLLRKVCLTCTPSRTVTQYVLDPSKEVAPVVDWDLQLGAQQHVSRGRAAPQYLQQDGGHHLHCL